MTPKTRKPTTVGQRKPAPKKPTTPKQHGGIDLLPGTRIDNYGVPWVGAVVLFVVGLVLHGRAFQTWLSRIPAAFGCLAGAAVVAGFVWQYAHARRPFLRWHATATAVLGGAGLATTILIGFTVVWWWVYAFTAATLALTWNARTNRVVRGEGDDHHPSSQWSKIQEVMSQQLPDAGVKVTDVTPDAVRVRVKAANGQGLDEIRNATGALENVLGTQHGSSRVLPLPGNKAGGGDLILIRQDTLAQDRKRPAWDGRRRSWADGLRPGYFADGTPVPVVLAAAEGEVPVNLSVVGKTRYGKSHLFRLCALDISEMGDVWLMLIDVAKGAQTAKPVRPALTAYADTKPKARCMFAGLQRLVKARSDWLGERGIDEWHPGCGLPAGVVWVEEGMFLLGTNTAFSQLSATCLGVGIWLVASQQRMSFAEMETTARSNIVGGIAFKVQDRQDAEWALSEEVLKIRSPHEFPSKGTRGRFLVDVPSVDDEHMGMEARTWFWADCRRDIAAQIAANAAGMCGLHEVDEKALGDVLEVCSVHADGRTERGRTGAPSADGSVDGATDEDVDDVNDDTDGPWTDDDEEDDDGRIQVDEMDEDAAPVHRDPEWTADLTAVDGECGPSTDGRRALPPLPPIEGEPMVWDTGADPTPPMTDEERDAVFTRVLRGVIEGLTPDAEGARVFAPHDLVGALLDEPRWDRSRPWVHERLKALLDAGALTRRRHGLYEVVAIPQIPLTDSDDGGLSGEVVSLADRRAGA